MAGGAEQGAEQACSTIVCGNNSSAVQHADHEAQLTAIMMASPALCSNCNASHEGTTRLQRLKAQAALLVARGGIVAAAAKVAEEGGGGGLGVPQVDDLVQVVDKHLAALVDGQRRRRLACRGTGWEAGG